MSRDQKREGIVVVLEDIVVDGVKGWGASDSWWDMSE